MRFEVLSLFPEYFTGPFDVSILKRAKEKKLIEISLVNIRDFSKEKHQKVDDRPYGGGPGMVMTAEPVVEAIHSVKTKDSYVVYLSAQGRLFNQEKSRALAQKKHLILLCGHYEGIDERVISQEVDEEISIGDYVLTSGCAAAIVLVESIARWIPGVLGNEQAVYQDSFTKEGILEGPHFTRPFFFRGEKVPQILISGHHAAIEKYRKEQALRKTYKNRPDLFQSKEDKLLDKENSCEPKCVN